LVFNWAVDRGLVAGTCLVLGGECANGYGGSDSVVDASIITHDSNSGPEFAESLHEQAPSAAIPAGPSVRLCGNEHSVPTSQYGSTLINIPKPATENDDMTCPAFSPRHLFDLALGGRQKVLHGGTVSTGARSCRYQPWTNKYASLQLPFTIQRPHPINPRTVHRRKGNRLPLLAANSLSQEGGPPTALRQPVLPIRNLPLEKLWPLPTLRAYTSRQSAY